MKRNPPRIKSSNCILHIHRVGSVASRMCVVTVMNSRPECRKLEELIHFKFGEPKVLTLCEAPIQGAPLLHYPRDLDLWEGTKKQPYSLS
ncbi:hypothetical protein TNCV_4925131 [Trichonephila clavipes]|nr:hypothetical protein TNCV_4925131 [Trichonephila clavipes]